MIFDDFMAYLVGQEWFYSIYQEEAPDSEHSQ